MRTALPIAALAAVATLAACSPGPDAKQPLGKMPEVVTTAKPEWIPWSIRAGKPVEADPRERHLTEVRKLTFGGDNAEAYWAPDGKKLIMQSTPPGQQCDQIYTIDLEKGDIKQISTGGGKTTCSYFFPAGDRLLYSS